MTELLRRFRGGGGDAGSALVMALLFLSLFGLITGVLLSFGFAGSRTQVVVKEDRDQRYAADGALEGAIKRFEKTGSCGDDPDNFFTYVVHGQTATVSCEASTLGGTPNPPQLLSPTSVENSDFYPFNNHGTSASLLQTLQAIEASAAAGTMAITDYIRPGYSSVDVKFTGATPPAGASFAQVSAIVSHREGTGVGCCVNQDQSIRVRTVAGGTNVDCGIFELNDWRAVGGPAWPSPPYEVIDVTYQQGFSGDPARFCLNTPERIQNAVITYNAHHSTCGGRVISDVSTTAGSDVLTSPSGNFALGDVQYPPGTQLNAPVVAQGTPNFLQNATTARAVISPTQLRLSKTATQTVSGRSVVLGSVCGSVNDNLDGIGLCVCLSSRPTVAVSENPVCNPAAPGGHAADPAWQVNHGNLQIGNKDCTNGNAANPKDGIFEAGEPTQVGGNLNSCGTLCKSNTHAWWRDADADVTRTLVLSGFTFDAPSTVEYVSLRVSHAEEASNLVIAVTVAIDGVGTCTVSVPTANTGTTAPTRRYVADQVMLPEECSPKTAALMAATTVRYAVTCAAVNGVCATGNRNPQAFVDGLVLDLNYHLGGPGGTPVATFVSSAGSTTVSATAQFPGDGSVIVGQYRVE